VAYLDITLQKFNDEEKKNVVRRIMEHEIVRAFLPKHINFNKGLKKALHALGNMHEAYATLTSAKQGQNSQYRNVLVIVMVSNAQNTSQIHIANAIGASRYMIQKTLECHVHVNET
jgi:hypothetical protein